MVMIDPERERRRLVEYYSRQMDGELEQVAAQAYDLTDIARESLRAEMARRGLTAALAEHAPVVPPVPSLPGDPPPEPSRGEPLAAGELEKQDMVTIRKFRDLPEALFAKGSLESAGIECALLDDNMVRLDWFISNLLGGVKLQVKHEDAEVAKQILEQPIPENFDVPGIGEYEQPRCPKCQSLDVNFREIAPAAYLSAAVSVPIPFHRRAGVAISAIRSGKTTELMLAHTSPRAILKEASPKWHTSVEVGMAIWPKPGSRSILG